MEITSHHSLVFEVKKNWGCASLTSTSFLSWCLIKHRTLAFTFVSLSRWRKPESFNLSSSSSSSSCSWRVRSVILFVNPQDEVGLSTSSLVVPCSFVLSVYIVMLVSVVYLCPSSVRVVATFSGIVLFPLLYSVLLFLFPNTLILFFI